jgi:hypothetical protein
MISMVSPAANTKIDGSLTLCVRGGRKLVDHVLQDNDAFGVPFVKVIVPGAPETCFHMSG